MTKDDFIFNLKRCGCLYKDGNTYYEENELIKCFEDVGAFNQPSANPQEPCDDAISRILKRMWNCRGKHTTSIDKVKMEQIIRDELSVTPQEPKTIQAVPQWIPITYRPMMDEEKKHYSEYTGYNEEDFDTMLDCPLPEDGETVLITDRLGNVEVDTFMTDNDGCYFECNCDINDIKAWMPLPKPYKAESEE